MGRQQSPLRRLQRPARRGRRLHVRVRSFRAGDAFSFGSTQVNVLAPFPRLPARPRAHQQRLAGPARRLRRNLRHARRRRRSPHRSSHAGRIRASRAPCSKSAITAASPPRAPSSSPASPRSGPSSPADSTTATAIPARKSWRSCKPPTSAPSAPTSTALLLPPRRQNHRFASCFCSSALPERK
jgi:hypothetical protein